MTNPIPTCRPRRSRRSPARRGVAALLRAAARGIGRRRLQQLVRSSRSGIGCVWAGPPFRSDALSEELDRHPLRRATRGGAERRSRPRCAHLHFRALLCASRGAGQMRAEDCAHPAKTTAQSRTRPAACPPGGRRAPARTPASPTSGDPLIGSPLDRRLTFATFQVGRSNQLAFSAAQRVADPNGGGYAGLLPALRSFGRRSRQDPSLAGGCAYRRSDKGAR